MAVALTDIQGRMAPGAGAHRHAWSAVAAPATAHRHATVTVAVPFAYGLKPWTNGISGWPREGSS
jgi:hypothetical protein